MRINRLDNIFQIYNKNSNTNKVNGDKRIDGKDEIKLSEKAVEFQYALKKVKEVDDIRKDKVDRIKAQVKSGTYYVDGKKVVEKILEDISLYKKI
ncbi:MAG TPA: flagellar biosynthesis anti-sigma factor FlgM [Tissierellaceae bacterium]